MTSLSPSNEANHTQPPIKLEDAPLRGGDIIMMRLPLDLTSHDTTSDITWTPTSGSGSPRHPVVWISGSDIPQNDGTTLTTVNVLVMRSFRTSQAASLVVQNSESSRFILPFPSPSSVDATPATPPEFGPSLRSPFFTPLYQTWLHARITRFDVLSNTMIKRFQPRALLRGDEFERVLDYARRMAPALTQAGNQMAPRGGQPGPSGGGRGGGSGPSGGGAGSSNTNRRGRGAGSGASQRGKAGRFGSQGKVSRGTKMHSSHGWGGPVPGKVRGPGVIDSISNSGFRDDESRYDTIDDYLPREPPPIQDFLDLEHEYQKVLAKERQSTVAHWLSGI